MTRAAIIKAYQRYYNPAAARMFSVADCPVESHGTGSIIYDTDQKAYIDFCTGYGVFSLGHAHREIKEALLRQLSSLSAPTPGFLQQTAADFIQKLVALMPEGLNKVFLSASGSEAIEIALRTAMQAFPKKTKIVAAVNGYHGKSLGALSIMGQVHLRSPFGPLMPDVHFVPYGDIQALQSVIDPQTLAVFLEPVLGGGYLEVPPAGYLTAVRNWCSLTGSLLILDEVQTGFGRTGKLFAFEWEPDLVPDMLVASKAICGGYMPIAVTVIQKEIIAKLPLDKALYFENMLSVTPLSCVAASSSLSFIQREDLPKKVEEKGNYLKAELERIAQDFPDLVLDVPGRGLMLGLKLANALIEHALWLQLLKRGVVAGLSTNTVAPHPVLRLFPPLTIDYQQLDSAAEAIRAALRALHNKPAWLLNLANHCFRYQHHLPLPLLKIGKHLLGA